MGDIILSGLSILLAAGLLWNAIVGARQWVKKIRTDAYQQGYADGVSAGASMVFDALKSVRKAVFTS
jgi:hypothetical protein